MKHNTHTRVVSLALAAASTAAVVIGLGVTAASATTSSDTVTVEAFRETVKPWDSISIPSLSCPTGWLVDENLSPSRYAPMGSRSSSRAASA